ncbi:hypothetical protein NECAME_03183 [Necator americanus]|uniref:Uncharacterized protein n=1 Tax=Necator americanus TaxID=51031 RepID=W2T7A8_NECAM|nr:hypothetical protein NECAME_03183 [Necator americanus]ETN77519.1 hypothetical protein NECAME_03183 [Necator americanus]
MSRLDQFYDIWPSTQLPQPPCDLIKTLRSPKEPLLLITPARSLIDLPSLLTTADREISAWNILRTCNKH